MTSTDTGTFADPGPSACLLVMWLDVFLNSQSTMDPDSLKEMQENQVRLASHPVSLPIVRHLQFHNLAHVPLPAYLTSSPPSNHNHRPRCKNQWARSNQAISTRSGAVSPAEKRPPRLLLLLRTQRAQAQAQVRGRGRKIRVGSDCFAFSARAARRVASHMHS